MIERRLATAIWLLPLAGCSLLLDFSELPDAGLENDAADPCTVFEPNEEPASAASPSTYPVDAAICEANPNDRDYFSFDADGATDIVIRLTMADGTGPRSLALRLYDAAENEIDVSDTEANVELIERSDTLGTQLEAGTYYVEVAGSVPDNTNTYSLVIE